MILHGKNEKVHSSVAVVPSDMEMHSNSACLNTKSRTVQPCFMSALYLFPRSYKVSCRFVFDSLLNDG